jgi:hypothetical protein
LGEPQETPTSELDPGKYPSVTILKYSEKACSEKSKWTAMNAEDILKFMLSDFARKGVFDEILDEAVDWKGPPELVSLMQAHVAAPPVAPNIQDGFIHYQLIRFCQATRLQYVNGQVTLANQNVLQQHVDHHIASALLKKGTRDAYKTWNQQDRAWVDMRLHESHDEGGFGVSNNTITRHAASYTTNARFVAFLGTFARPAQQVWMPGNDLQDPTSWDAPPLARSSACTGTSCSSTTAPSSRQWHSSRSRPTQAGALLPTRAHLAFKRSQVSPSASSSSQDQQAQQPPKSVIPTQRRVTEQPDWAPFKALRQH